MYRNLSYIISPERQWEAFVVLDTWDAQGHRIRKTIPHQSYLYHKDPHGDHTSIFKDKIKLKMFKNTGQRKKWIEQNYNNTKIFECLPPKVEFLQSYFSGQNLDMGEFTKHPLRVCFLDIEIAVQDEFPEPAEAKYPINIITYYDTADSKYYSYILGDAVINREDVVLKKFLHEEDLLKAFLDDFRIKQFDVVTGWNSSSFDMFYIYKRLERLFGEDTAKTLSPTKSSYQSKISLHGDPVDYVVMNLDGISQLDYMMLYKRFIVPMEGAKSSYALDFICNEELGHGKLAYDGDFKHLYTTDFQKFVEYNLRDVELVVELDAKRKFIDLTRTLCNLSLVEYERIFVASAPVVGCVVQMSRKLNVKIPYVRMDTFTNKEEKEEDDLKGGFVKEPGNMAFKKGLTIFDIESLYPNIMMAFNISPETILGKIEPDKEPDGSQLVKFKGREPSRLTWEQIKYIKTNDKYCVAENGCIYSTEKEGIIPAFLKEFFSVRVKLKQEAKRLEKQIHELELEPVKDTFKIETLRKRFKLVDLEQTIRKIILNTTYGVCGSKYSIFYNIDNGNAITVTGQAITQHASVFINNYMKKYKKAGDEDKNYVVYNDTDSMFVNTEPIIQNKFNGEFKEFKKIISELDLMSTKLNEWLKTELSHNIYNMYKKDRFKFAREKFCDISYLFKKKRYILHMIEKEGTKIDKFSFKGISLVRSTYPKFMKKRIKEIYERSVRENWNNTQFIDYVTGLYDEFCKLDFNDVSMYKKINVYKHSTEFLETPKGSAGHSKAAVYYNQLIDKLKINHKYDYIGNSNNMRICYVRTDNDYGINVIAFKDTVPDEFRAIFKPDYVRMFEMLFLKPLEDFCHCNGWNAWLKFDKYEISIEEL